MSDVHTALRERKTVHDYVDAPLPEGSLVRALEAALAAPNHRMTEPWRFVRVGKQARETLVDISVSIKAEKAGGPLDESTRAQIRQKMMNPAELLVVCQRLTAAPDVMKEDYAAVACALQSLFLSLWADGVGSKWGTGAVTTDRRTYDHLGVDGQVEEIVGFVYAGIPGKDSPKVPRKLSLEDVLRELP